MAHNDYDRPRTPSSNTSGSVISDLSVLNSDDYSDESQRRLLRHARDKRRMRNALGEDGRVVAFRKARPRPRLVSKLDNGTTNNGDMVRSNNGGSRRSSLDSLNDLGNLDERISSFSPNIPRQWATKGRQRNNFLRRINSNSPVERPRTPEQDPDIIYRRRTTFTGDSPHSDIDWTAGGADIPRHTVEPDSPSRLRRSPMYESFRRRRAERAVSGRHLTGLPPDSEDFILEHNDPPVEHYDEVDRSPAAIASRRRIPSTRIAIDYTEESRPLHELPLGAATRDFISKGPAQKSSRELLRQFANRSSISPAPKSPRLSDARRPSTSSSRNDQGSAQPQPQPPATSSTEAETIDPTAHPRQALQPSVMEDARSTSTLPDHRLPTPPEDEVFIRESKKPAPLIPIESGKGDAISGPRQLPPLAESEDDGNRSEDEVLFRESKKPAPVIPIESDKDDAIPGPRQPPALVGSKNNEHRLEDDVHEAGPSQAPNVRPRSALEAVLQTREEEEYGDETIASLGRVVEDDATMDLSDLLPLDDETMNLITNVNVRMHRGEEIRQEERDQLKRMNDSLKAARSGVRSASKGLKRIGHQVEGADVRDTASPECCERCGCPGSATLSGILSGAFRSLRDHFYKKSRTGWTLTWLGVISAIILVWSMLEVTLW